MHLLLQGESIFFDVSVALCTVTRWTGTLLGMTADAEFMPFCLVYAKRPWRAFMAFSARVEPHMLGMVEVDVTVICLENFCLSC